MVFLGRLVCLHIPVALDQLVLDGEYVVQVLKEAERYRYQCKYTALMDG